MTKSKPRSKVKAKARPKAQPAAAAPTFHTVTADTITRAQIRYLDKEAKAAGDDPMRDECRIALDPGASASKRKSALECCADLWNALQTIARAKR